MFPCQLWHGCFQRYIGNGEKADIMMLFGAIYLFSIIYRITFHELYAAYGHEMFNILSRQVFGQLMYFYAGVFIYFQYERFMRYRLHIVAGCVLFMLLGDYIPYYQFIISPLVVSSLVIFFSSFKMMPVFNRHNISYDIYLFHMPIMMTVCSLPGRILQVCSAHSGLFWCLPYCSDIWYGSA